MEKYCLHDIMNTGTVNRLLEHTNYAFCFCLSTLKQMKETSNRIALLQRKHCYNYFFLVPPNDIKCIFTNY